MDEIMNNNTNGIDSTSTIYTTDNISTLAFTVNTTWDFLNNYYEWPKGVPDYSFEKKYTPKWHIKEGYKNQMKIMWD